ncbi:MotA/TolQ/ExbB proton channel family protein [Treponema sp. OMZ 788]|uniref:MotA/TolQ/ExbB proton channel family protein n=1 Tax=Treponema sp. OMZ 788 TaxID=2563664 RepID=UPI0020A5510B|nr:MotA/TolQ/ExbB proton channel family protein [Treponema sp. OMZ 788]UTC64528.1 MotA/TolQ/ExbB proton channel family protein [Treponema sp. OMZ 788]
MKEYNKFSGSVIKVTIMLIGFILIGFIGLIFNIFQVENINVNQFDRNDIYPIFVLFFIFIAIILPLQLLGISMVLKKIINKMQDIKKTSYDDYGNIIAGYEKIFTSKKYLAHIWIAYFKTFIHSTTTEYIHFKDKTRANADLYFNAEEIVSYAGTKLPSISLLKIVSGAFVGLGILGTFMGFSQSLSGGIDIQNQDQLDVIVAGLKVALNTSIFGLFSSIVYNFLIANPILQLLNDRCKFLSDELDDSFYISDEECMRALGHVVFETKESIVISNSDMTEKVSAVILQGRENFTNELNKTANILMSISNELEKTPETIQIVNKELRESIETAKKNNQEMIDYAVNSIEDKITSLFKNFADRFDTASGTILSSMDSVKDLPIQLQNLLTDSSEHFKKHLSEVMLETEKHFNSASEIMYYSMNSVKDLPIQFQNLLTDSSEHFKANISEVMQETKKIFNLLMEDVNKDIKETLSDIAKENIQNNKEMLYETKESFAGISETMKSSFESFIDSSTESIESVIEDTKNQLLDCFRGFTVSVDDTVKNIDCISEKLSALTTDYSGIGEVLMSASNSIKEADKDLSASVRKVFEDIPIKMEAIVENLSQAAIYVNKVSESMNGMEELPEKIRNILKEFTKTTNQLQTTYNTTMDKIENLYCESSKIREGNIDGLVSKLDTVTKSMERRKEEYINLGKLLNDNFAKLSSKITNILALVTSKKENEE